MAAKKKRTAPQKPAWHGFLTECPPTPEEFQPDGKRVLIDAPEFRLVETWYPSGTTRKVEWSEQVRTAYLRSMGNKQQTRRNTELEEVLSMMQALYHLAGYTDTEGGEKQICGLMAAALARFLREIENAKDATQAKIAIENASTLCASAFSGFAAMAGSLMDSRRSSSKPTPADLIKIADFLISCSKRVSSKEEIQRFAEGQGLRITGKRNIADEWMQLFTDAGLGGLPSSPDL
jgi:hypothetical protein